jgi:hypothetical protein
MKKILLSLCILFSCRLVLAQNHGMVPTLTKAMVGHNSSRKDTVIESDTSKENKEPRYYYVTASTNFFVNTKGGFAKRFAPALELGRTYGIFDIGLATGMFNTLNGDTSRYLEFRPTINVFSKGRFSESFCLGAGYVFNSKQALVTEICNAINFDISENLAVAVTQGYCFFDGTNSSRSAQYMGFSVTYNFLKPHSVNKQRKKKAIVSDN